MISLVIVSHSARLAEGVRELAEQVARGKVRIAAAGGTSDQLNPIGTDAYRVLDAIKSVFSDDGVLVLMDLGSAVLSAETALELLDPARRARVRLCSAPLVEGAVAAVSQAAAGAGLDEILREAQGALAAKVAQIGGSEPVPALAGATAESRLLTLPNPLGLHARPAAQFIRLARRFQARVTIENITTSAGPAEAASINGVLALGARQGHQLLLRAQGPEARQALDALTSFVKSGCGDEETQPLEVSAPAPRGASHGLMGIPASSGIAMAPLARLRPAPIGPATVSSEDPEAEWQRLLAAIRDAQDETRALYDWAAAHLGRAEAAIFDAQSLFLEDPALVGNVSRMVLEERSTAEFAWRQATADLAARMSSLDDPYLRARAADVRDVAARVLRRLAGLQGGAMNIRKPSIVAAHDLAPSEVHELDPAVVLGLCLETGTSNSHSVILARAMGIPAVVGLGPALASIPEGTPMALDGDRGTVWVSPGPEDTLALEQSRQAWMASRRLALAERHRPAATRDGHPVRVLANLSHESEVLEALDSGAEGVGVLRTEFLFMGRSTPPEEEEQLAAYRTIASALGTRPLVIRTLDIGGDKGIPYVEVGQEANPFLGCRGIRLMLGRRDLLCTQLRAILRAACGHTVEILFPMVSSLPELRQAKAVLRDVEADLEREGVTFSKGVTVGVMIEVPSAVAVADQLAREVSAFSIGTNDLIQYVMAADRTNARVAAMADPLQPAVLRVLNQTIQAGRRAGIRVTLCGELAADPLATPLLLGLGLEEFSVSAPLIPGLKRAIAGPSLPEAVAIARQALKQESSDAVRALLSRQPAAQTFP